MKKNKLIITQMMPNETFETCNSEDYMDKFYVENFNALNGKSHHIVGKAKPTMLDYDGESSTCSGDCWDFRVCDTLEEAINEAGVMANFVTFVMDGFTKEEEVLCKEVIDKDVNKFMTIGNWINGFINEFANQEDLPFDLTVDNLHTLYNETFTFLVMEKGITISEMYDIYTTGNIHDDKSPLCVLEQEIKDFISEYADNNIELPFR